MTWFKENKFLAGLLFLTSLIAALLIFLGLKFGSSLKEVRDEIAVEESSLEGMKTLDLYPTPQGAEEKKENLLAVLAKANEARDKLIAYRPESMDNVSGKIFAESLNSSVDRVRELFPKEGALPKGFNLGFEEYAGSPAKENATGALTYQLGALENVFNELAAAGVEKVQNLSRPKLPAENGEDWPNAVGGKKVNKTKPSKGKSKGGRTKSPFEKLPAVAHRLPFELTFKAPEGAARKFLTQLANSEDYFIETRIARVLNPAPIPSGGKALAPKEKNDFAEGLEMEGEEKKSMEDKPMMSEKMLNKISGGDDLVIYLRADLLLFIDEQKFPELK